ncbi:hypothetical protein JTB14_027136 [Gonioctena quinquepunctata]|nr:hypothetical protein JTB14_027136 [Gonioctena quinquepunctata]
MEKVSYAKKTQQTSAPINEPATSRGVAGSAKIPEVTEEQLSRVLLETETRKKCNDYINLANHNEVAADNGEWKQVVKKKTRRQLVVGQNNSIKINGKEMKGIPKMTLLHVYRVDPTMTATVSRNRWKQANINIFLHQGDTEYGMLKAIFQIPKHGISRRILREIRDCNAI